jgi:transcriptional antiterminator
MSNRELIEDALKRVNDLAGTDGKLMYDRRYGYYIVGSSAEALFDSCARNAGETIAYLHGFEDALSFIKKRSDELSEIVKEMRKNN